MCVCVCVCVCLWLRIPQTSLIHTRFFLLLYLFPYGRKKRTVGEFESSSSCYVLSQCLNEISVLLFCNAESVALISLVCPVASAERLNVDILSVNNIYCFLFIGRVITISIKILK